VSAVASDVAGKVGSDVFADAKLKAPVRSPTVALRHAVS
jgi:hypothetical protein